MPASRLCSLSAAAELAQRARQVLRGVGERRVRGQPVGPRRSAQDLRERRQGFLDGAELDRDSARGRRARLHELLARIAHQQLDLPAAEARAEELRGEIGDLVRLVEDHRVRGAQQIAETVFLEREIREQQMVIDDDDVGFDGLAARVDHVALPISAQRAPRQLSRVEVTCGHSGCASPRSGTSARSPVFVMPAQRSTRASVRSRVPARLFCAAELLQAVGAQIVRAALEQRDARRHADGAGDQRQVFVEELVLQRARAGGDEHPFARQQRRHEVGEGLAGARARLDHERRAVFDAPAPRGWPWPAANGAA